MSSSICNNNNNNSTLPFALYVSGLGTSGQLGIHDAANHDGYQDEQAVKPVGISPSVFGNEHVMSAECGWYHSVVVTKPGSVYTCGAGYSHQAGHPTTVNTRCFTKLPFTFHGRVTKVSCGGHHTLVLTELGRLYTFGEGREGQLGTGGKVPASCPKEVVIYEEVEGRQQQVFIKHVAAGGYHSLLVDYKNRVWSFGKNTYGQLGLHKNNEEYVLTPTLISKVSWDGTEAEAIEFVDVAAGAWHSILLTARGQVFGMGDTQYGQLGIVQYQDSQQPRFSSTSSAPMPDDTSYTSSAIIARYYLPELITALSGTKIKQVSCGYFHSAFLTTDGRVLTCGWGAYGQLGNNANQSERLPKLVSALARVRIHNLSCGWNHVMCVSDQGVCYTFGEAKHGQLGIESSVKQRQLEVPTKLTSIPFPVRRVACGRGHTIFLTGELEAEVRPHKFTRVTYTDVRIITRW